MTVLRLLLHHTWIYLKAVVTLVGIFKQAVHWVEHFMRKKKEPLSVEEVSTIINFTTHQQQYSLFKATSTCGFGNPTLQHHHNPTLLLL